MNTQPPVPERSVAPVLVALGIALLLVGLIVSPLVLVPLGTAISVAAAAFWACGPRDKPAREPEPVVPPDNERYPRSRLLERATLGLGALIGLGVTLPAAGFAVLPAFLGGRRHAVDLGPINAFPEGRFVVATFLSDRRAGEISRRAAYVRNNGTVRGLPSFTIMSSRCTHIGCPTQPNGPLFASQRRAAFTSAGEVGLVPTQPSGFGCPCHGSQFDTEGNRTAGPAPRALDRYEFSIRNGHLWLGRLFSVSHVEGTGSEARIRSVPLEAAGQPANGIESWLYPLQPPS